MTKTPWLTGTVLALGLVVASPVSAQVMILGSDGCTSLPPCVTGGMCPGADDHPVTLPAGCFCAPGAVAGTELPSFCCIPGGTTVRCPGGTCTAFFDSSGGICTNAEVTYCGTASGVSLATNVGPCHQTPDGTFSLYWRGGDCDGDGVPNGEEALDPLRDPCEMDDLHRCLSGGIFTAAECCTLAPDPGACCAEAGGGVECCLAQAEYGSCCATVAAASPTDETTPLVCCVNDPAVTDTASCCTRTDGMTGAACCEALGGPVGLCCEAGIFCAPEPDAGAPAVDGGNTAGDDAGTAPAMDAGTSGPPVEMPHFGGGGGAFCSVGHRTTPMPAILGASILLALVIPGLRSRRGR